MDEGARDRQNGIALSWLDWVVLVPAVLGYLSLIAYPFVEWHPSYAITATPEEIAAVAAREAAFWGKWATITQAVSAVMASAAATFAALAYREGQRSRIAAERQAAVAENQLALARDEARSAEFASITEKFAQQRAVRAAAHEKTRERDERAAATRAVLVLGTVDLVRGSRGGLPIYEARFTATNVGGSVALDVVAQCEIEVRHETHDAKNSSGERITRRAITTSGHSLLEPTVEMCASDFMDNFETARDFINDPVTVSASLTVEWRDVHGYRITHTYGIEEYFLQQDYSHEDVAIILRREVIMLGEREVTRREP